MATIRSNTKARLLRPGKTRNATHFRSAQFEQATQRFRKVFNKRKQLEVTL
jgi:hypothetical protein